MKFNVLIKAIIYMRNIQLKILGFVGIGYIIIVTVLFVIAYHHSLNTSSLIDTKAFADYGSHLAGIGAVFAFFFAFATFWRIEASNKKRDFEATFFDMLTHFDSIIAQIKVFRENRIVYGPAKISVDREFNGRAALIVLLEDYLENVNSGNISVEELTVDEFDTDIDLIPVRWNEVYNQNLGSLPHYFRYYYTLVKFIMKSDKSIEKKFYADLLQAKMSSSEMGLIFYNTFYNSKIYPQRGAQEFQQWLNDKDIGLLENIDAKSVVSTDDLKAKCPNITFKFELLKNHSAMSTKIKMGNDEFILYIRKTSKCTTSTQQLGRQIWEWLRDNGAQKIYNELPQPCYWGNMGDFIDEERLPMTATQFEFDRDLLPKLYEHLDVLKTL